MGARRVLVLDDDPWVLELIVSTLKKRKLEVDRFTDAHQALLFVQGCRPDLIILDLLMPGMSGSEFLEKVRRSAWGRKIPVLILTGLDSSDARVPRQLDEWSEIITKPFRFESLLKRVDERLSELASQEKKRPVVLPPPLPLAKKKQGPTKNKEEDFDLSGRLKQLAFPSILTMLEMEKKSGVLTLSPSEQPVTSPSGARKESPGREAKIVLQDGRVVRAELLGGSESEVRGAECVYEVMRWRDGSFVFRIEGVEGTDEIGQSTMSLLMEGARRLDESDR